MGATIEEQAIQELIQNIVQRGDGKVWMDDWRGRFGSLGPTPKDFMEQRPDVFNLVYVGRGYSVELIGDGEQMAKEMGGGAISAGPGPRKGGPKGGFILADPLPKGGFKGGKGGKGGVNLAAPVGKGSYGGGGGGGCGGGYEGGFKGGFKGGKSGGKGAANLALPFEVANGDLAEAAIAEIKDQMARRGEPKVWIEDWRERYQGLGPSPKQFMESRPDVFQLSYQGNRYSVHLVGGQQIGAEEVSPAAKEQEDLYWKGRGGATSVQEEPQAANLPDEQACISEISRLVAESPDGRIWIPDWYRRFAHLAKSPRVFLESRPDIFALTFKGNTYAVSLVAQAAGPPPGVQMLKRLAPAGAPAELRPRPWKSTRTDQGPAMSLLNSASSPSTALVPTTPSISSIMNENSSALDYLGDKEEDALAEIFDQLSKPYSNGKVNFPDWAKRFGHLATSPREFIEGHPDKFEVIPGYGSSYTVELC